MELTTHQLDNLCEIQHNIDTTELDGAIDKLSDEQLLVLRHDCVASIDRQTSILARIQSRLARN